jgi:ABC-2 type transport system ATP-binding protein
MIKVENLSKWYGPKLAVDNVSFHIHEGEIVGFLGPNGAGKTTTLRVLTCFIPPSAGRASVAGHDVFERSLDVRRMIGYLPENTPLYPEMRVREYLEFRGKLRGLTRSRRRDAIGRATDRCWLGEFVDRPIGQLSKGMRQRVGLAEALLHDPPVLILDEPTIGLDPTQQRETRNLIRDLAKQHTVLLSSHNLPEVEHTCERSLIIAGGRIVASGTPEELKDRIRGGSRLIAEIRGPEQEVTGQIRALAGVKALDAVQQNGWYRLTIETAEGQDVREDIYRLAADRGWGLREIRLEVGSLEEYFVQITARQLAEQG